MKRRDIDMLMQEFTYKYGRTMLKRIAKAIFCWAIIAAIIFAMVHFNMKGSVDYADAAGREFLRQQNQKENAQIMSEQFLTH